MMSDEDDPFAGRTDHLSPAELAAHRMQQELYARIDALTSKASALVLAIEHDNIGTMVAGRYVGGSGGLITISTIKAADALRAELEKFHK